MRIHLLLSFYRNFHCTNAQLQVLHLWEVSMSSDAHLMHARTKGRRRQPFIKIFVHTSIPEFHRMSHWLPNISIIMLCYLFKIKIWTYSHCRKSEVYFCYISINQDPFPTFLKFLLNAIKEYEKFICCIILTSCLFMQTIHNHMLIWII